MRLKPATWQMLWDGTIPDSVGHPLVAVAAALGVLIARRRRALFALAVAAFLIHFAVFAELDRAHMYYWYGMAVFLVAAVGFAAVALLECADVRRHLAWLLVSFAVFTCVQGYVTKMVPIQRRDAYEKPDWFIRMASALNEPLGPTT